MDCINFLKKSSGGNKDKQIGEIGGVTTGSYVVESGGKMLDLSVRPTALPSPGRKIDNAQVKPKK